MTHNPMFDPVPDPALSPRPPRERGRWWKLPVGMVLAQMHVGQANAAPTLQANIFPNTNRRKLRTPVPAKLARSLAQVRAAGGPPPEPVPPTDDTTLRIGQAARLMVLLGPGDVPTRPEQVRLASRAAAAAGGWAQLRGVLDAVDFTTADARRALRAAVGATHPKALTNKRAWNVLRARFPRLPAAEDLDIGEPRRKDGDDGGSRTRRRRRRRMHSPATGAAQGATTDGASVEASAAEQTDGSTSPTPDDATPPARSRRRRRRRRSRSAGAGEGGTAPETGDT